jgi:hypothetical protein
MHARLDRGPIQLLTRTGLDWRHKYPSIAAALSALPLTIRMLHRILYFDHRPIRGDVLIGEM